MFKGTQEDNQHLFTVVYYSKYDFGDYKCFVVKGDEIYESATVKVPTSGQPKDTKIVTNDIVLTQNKSIPLSLQLSCQVSDVLNSSRVFWLKDGSLIYETNPLGGDVTVDKRFTGNYFICKQNV